MHIPKILGMQPPFATEPAMTKKPNGITNMHYHEASRNITSRTGAKFQ